MIKFHNETFAQLRIEKSLLWNFITSMKNMLSQLVRKINKGDDAVFRRAPPLINGRGVKIIKTTNFSIHPSRDPNVLNDCEVVTKIWAIVFDELHRKGLTPPSPQATMINNTWILPRDTQPPPRLTRYKQPTRKRRKDRRQTRRTPCWRHRYRQGACWWWLRHLNLGQRFRSQLGGARSRWVYRVCRERSSYDKPGC